LLIAHQRAEGSAPERNATDVKLTGNVGVFKARNKKISFCGTIYIPELNLVSPQYLKMAIDPP
jgi:hypothetical protein